MRKELVFEGMWIKMNRDATKKYGWTKEGAVGKVMKRADDDINNFNVAFIVETLCGYVGSDRDKRITETKVSSLFFEEFTNKCSYCSNQGKAAKCNPCDNYNNWAGKRLESVPVEPVDEDYDEMEIEDDSERIVPGCDCSECTRERNKENNGGIEMGTTPEDIYDRLKITVIGSTNGRLVLSDGRQGIVESENINILLTEENKKELLKALPKIYKDRHNSIPTSCYVVTSYYFKEFTEKK